MGLLTLGELSQGDARPFLKMSRGRARRVSRPTRSYGLAGLGQGADCGPVPALGPGELKTCCPDIGWVIYDQHESPYALCERAMASATSSGSDSAPTASSDWSAKLEAERRAGELELEARRQAMEARRIALEERQFQQRLQTVMLQAQIKRAQREAAMTPEAKAERAAAARAAAARAEGAVLAEKAAQQKKLAYAALAAVAAKMSFF